MCGGEGSENGQKENKVHHILFDIDKDDPTIPLAP